MKTKKSKPSKASTTPHHTTMITNRISKGEENKVGLDNEKVKILHAYLAACRNPKEEIMCTRIQKTLTTRTT